MTLSTCPIATINAPVERAWSLLADPANYDRWWDAETRAVTPAGPGKVGQKIFAQTKELGRQWDVNIVVEMVDQVEREIKLTTRLPFGITVHNHIRCVPLENTTCRVTFG